MTAVLCIIYICNHKKVFFKNRVVIIIINHLFINRHCSSIKVKYCFCIVVLDLVLDGVASRHLFGFPTS